MFCRLVSQVLINWQAYVFIRPKSLSVKGHEPIFVYVICRTLIKIKHHCVQTDHEERVMGD
jgi:hypothetical protein